MVTLPTSPLKGREKERGGGEEEEEGRKDEQRRRESREEKTKIKIKAPERGIRIRGSPAVEWQALD